MNFWPIFNFQLLNKENPGESSILLFLLYFFNFILLTFFVITTKGLTFSVSRLHSLLTIDLQACIANSKQIEFLHKKVF